MESSRRAMERLALRHFNGPGRSDEGGDMTGLVTAATTAAALGAAATGGVLVAFSAFVMPALRALPAAGGAGAMRAINRSAVRPPFMSLFLGTAVASAALVVAGALDRGEPHGWRLLAGGALYLVGVVGVTAAFHVPRNDALEAAGPAAGDAAWRVYARAWTAGNHVRAVAGIAAAVVFADALRVG
jgi:uncharacterized membrane protein